MSVSEFTHACQVVEAMRLGKRSVFGVEQAARAPFGGAYLRALQLAADDLDMDARIRWAAQAALARISTREAA